MLDMVMQPWGIFLALGPVDARKDVTCRRSACGPDGWRSASGKQTPMLRTNFCARMQKFVRQ